MGIEAKGAYEFVRNFSRKPRTRRERLPSSIAKRLESLPFNPDLFESAELKTVIPHPDLFYFLEAHLQLTGLNRETPTIEMRPQNLMDIIVLKSPGRFAEREVIIVDDEMSTFRLTPKLIDQPLVYFSFFGQHRETTSTVSEHRLTSKIIISSEPYERKRRIVTSESFEESKSNFIQVVELMRPTIENYVTQCQEAMQTV